MSAALGRAWRRSRRSPGPLLLMGVLLASGCAPVRGPAPALSFHRGITAFDVQFRPRGRALRRPALKGSVQVQRVRLVYQGGALMPNQKALESTRKAVRKDIPEVEVVFQ